MNSNVVDEKVVEMKFDNRNFEKNVEQSQQTIDKLMDSLKFKGATKGFDEIEKSTRKVDFSFLNNGVETVRSKFSALEVMAVTALANITNSAVNAGKRTLAAFTIDPIKTGLQEYETQINAVQTILANTSNKGTTIDDVNAALDELNTYADKTIYNFTQMTRNIGTFTAAGLDLKTSTSAIQGIANVAAVSGSTSQQASTAMYQLSQALSAGTVKLQDWNSVVNAGMGGQVMQDALKATAREAVKVAERVNAMSDVEQKAYKELHGYTDDQMEAIKAYSFDVDAIIDKAGSFRNSLQEGWITSDVLARTLNAFTKTGAVEYIAEMTGASKEAIEELQKTGDTVGYDSAQVKKMADEIAGGNEELSKTVISTVKMATTAEDAATKVKTFTQLMDTLKEAAQSGWTQTWEILIGDFEEAKTLWTKVSDVFSEIINTSAKSRNDLLELWAKAGGRDQILNAFKNVWAGIESVIKPVKEALSDIFPPATAGDVWKITYAIEKFTEKLTLTDERADKVKRTFKGVFAAIDIVWTITKEITEGIVDFIGHFAGFGDTILDSTASIGDWIVSLRDSIKENGAFGDAVDKVVQFLITSIEQVKEFAGMVKQYLSDTGIIDIFNRITTSIKNVITSINIDFHSTGFETFFKLLENIWEFTKKLTKSIFDVAGEITKSLLDVFTDGGLSGAIDIANGGIFGAILLGVQQFVSGLTSPFKNGGLLDNINETLEGTRDILKSYQHEIQANTLIKIAAAVLILAVALTKIGSIPEEKISSSLGAVTALIGELFGSMVAFEKIMGKTGTKNVNSISGSLIKLAIAVLILGKAMEIIAGLTWEEVGKGIVGIAAGIGVLVGAMNLLPKKGFLNSNAKQTKGIIKLAVAMIILAKAMKMLAKLSWEELGKGIVGVVAGLGAMVGAINLLPKDSGKRTRGVIKMAVALIILAKAMQIMATMSWEEIGKGLVGLVVGLGAMVGAINLLPKDTGLRVLGLVGMAIALVILSGALKILATMSWDELGRSLVALGGALAEIVIAMKLMTGAIPGAAALIIVAIALGILTPVLMALGSMSWEAIGKGLVALGGSLAVIGIAGLLLKPLVPTIFALAGAIALFGLGCALAGAGVLLLSIGLASIGPAFATSATSFVAGFGIIIGGLLDLAPMIIEKLKTIVLSVCSVFTELLPTITETVLKAIVSMLTSLVDYMPQIVPLLFDLITLLLNSLTEKLPELMTTLVNFLVALMNGIAENAKPLVDAAFNLIKSIFGAVINSLASITEGILAPMLSIISEIIVGIVNAIAPYMPEITEMFTTITKVIADAIVKIVDAIAPYFPNIEQLVASTTTAVLAICDAFVALVNQLAPIIEQITELVTALADAITDILDSISTTIATAGDTIAEVFESIGSVIESVGKAIKSVLDGIADVISSIGEAALNAGTGFENMANGIAIITGLKIADMAASLAAVSIGLADIAKNADGIAAVGDGMKKLADSIVISSNSFGKVIDGLNVIGNVTPAVSGLTNGISAAIDPSKIDAGSKGKKVGTDYILGVSKGLTAPTANSVLLSTMSTVMTTVYNSASSKVGDFVKIGERIDDGIVQGVKNRSHIVNNNIIKLITDAYNAGKDAAVIRSPSRLFRDGIGRYIPLGIAAGIEEYGWRVNQATEDVMIGSFDKARDQLSSIALLADESITVQPTIRPVVDLTDVRSSANDINRMFGTVSMMASGVGNVKSGNVLGMERDASFAKALAGIVRSGKTGDTYTIGNVSYDSDSTVGRAVEELVRAIRLDRRS